MSRQACGAILAMAIAGCGGGKFEFVTHAAFVDGAQVATGSLDVSGAALSTPGAVVTWPDDGRTINVSSDAPSGIFFHRGTVIAARGVFQEPYTSGDASEVLVRSVVRGPIAHTSSSTTVAGIEVTRDARTQVVDAQGANTTIAAIGDGTRVEVDGWADAAARLRASRIVVLPGSPAVLLRGRAVAPPAGTTFDVALARGGAAVMHVESNGVPLGGIAPDAIVRVAGDVVPGTPPTLRASSIAVEDAFLPRDGDTVVIEGVVTANGPTLSVGDYTVQFSDATATVTVPIGAHVIVRGTFAGGVVGAIQLQVLTSGS